MKKLRMMCILPCICLWLGGCSYYGIPSGEMVTLEEELCGCLAHKRRRGGFSCIEPGFERDSIDTMWISEA